MRPVLRPLPVFFVLIGAAWACLLFVPPTQSAAGPRPTPCWRVEDLRPGMKGHGRTVMKGTRVETFQAEILGVLRNTSPGRDLVLARLSGLGLEKTGVIAGMSGSPVYIEGKLVGAVAYAWPFGKEPIAGITPFCQMQTYVEAFERRDVAVGKSPTRVGLRQPVRVGGRSYDAVTVAQDFDTDGEKTDGLWMVPLRTPLSATGFTRRSLALLASRTKSFGLTPMMGGSTTARVAEEEKEVALEPGGPLAVSLITGDFDLSGIGTTTHIEGNRVYGWGHPFMSLGGCQLPMMTGYIHTIYPRQTVSFKMGSPLKEVGVMHADVSTCIAGWLGRKVEMTPIRIGVTLPGGETRTFNVKVVKQRALAPALIYAALTNSIDMEGDLPEELTAHLNARIELDGREPLEIKDTFSGFSGGRAPAALYGQMASLATALLGNPYKPIEIKRVDCETTIEEGRTTAEIESAELDAQTYCPGDTLRATVFLRPYKGQRQKVSVRLKLPVDLAEGDYSVAVCDEITATRMDIRGNPTLASPDSAERILESVRMQTRARRTNLVLRLPIGAHGVASNGKSLPDLPGSMVHILANARRTGPAVMTRGLSARASTPWVVIGSENLTFKVEKTRKVTRND